MVINRLCKHCSSLPVNHLPSLARVRRCFSMQGWTGCFRRRLGKYSDWQRWLIALAVLMSPWFFCMIIPPAHAAALTPARGVEFVLLYGNDVRGETDPCG